MKNKIVYIIVFSTAFLGVTGLLIFLNTQFNNIFKFDFSKPRTVNERSIKLAEKDYTQVEDFIKNEFKQEVIDSLKKIYVTTKTDTVYKVVLKDPTLQESLADAKVNFSKMADDLKNQKKKIETLETNLNAKQDSVYKDWIKSTVKLFEAMDSRKAAKIITEYSDNVARDIIYSMKKKKAAEILTQLDPQTVIQLTGKQ